MSAFADGEASMLTVPVTLRVRSCGSSYQPRWRGAVMSRTFRSATARGKGKPAEHGAATISIAAPVPARLRTSHPTNVCAICPGAGPSLDTIGLR